MLANLDESLNNTYAWTEGPAPFVVPAQVPYTAPILEPGFAPFANFFGARASLYAAPVLIPTAAVGKNPWDDRFGGIVATGPYNGPAPAIANLGTPPVVSMA